MIDIQSERAFLTRITLINADRAKNLVTLLYPLSAQSASSSTQNLPASSDQKLKRKPVITVVTDVFKNPDASPSSTFEYENPP